MKKRKLIALLSAVLMLCSIIPMGAINVSAAATTLFNNFDDGTVGNFKADETIVNENGALKWTTASWKNLYASFSVYTNAEYQVSFRIKAAASTAVDVKYLNGSWKDSGIEKDVINVGTEWQEYTRTVNTGSNTALVLLFQCHKATDVYLDNVKVAVYEAPAAPNFPSDSIYTEDFEGDHAWNIGGSDKGATFEVVSSTSLPYTQPTNGNYVVKHTIPDKDYPYLYNRTPIAVQPYTDYVVSFDILNSKGGNPVQVIIAENYWLGDAFATSVHQGIKPTYTTWETHSIVFNSGNRTQIYLGAKSQWANTTVYFDNFYIAPLNATATYDGYFTNGDFEQGGLEWLIPSNNKVVADPTGSGMGNVIKTYEHVSGVHMFSQNAKHLQVGGEYTLSFKVYSYSTADNAAFWITFPTAFTNWTVRSVSGGLSSASANNYTPRINMNGNNAAWHTVEIDFTAASTTANIDFKNYRVDQGFYYFDDIQITPKNVAPLSDGYITNGGYETGAAEGGWDMSSAVEITPYAAYDSAFGVKLKGDGGWGGIMSNTFTTIPNTTYKISFQYKAISNGVNWALANDDYRGMKLGANYIETTHWTSVETIFVAGSTTTYLNFNGSGTGTPDEVYVDSIKIEVLYDALNTFAGKSVAEFDGETGGGLAFKFDMPKISIGSDGGTIYDYTGATIGASNWKLIDMGAVVSNRTDAEFRTYNHMDREDATNNRTIDVHAYYLYADDDTTSSFVVRVKNIPPAGQDTVIYARPYYVVEIDNTQVTIYGAVQSASYNAVANG